MNGRELMNKAAGGKRVWRDGMIEKLREMKRKYQHAAQRASDGHFKFSAKYNIETGNLICMECGVDMAMKKTGCSNYECPQCKTSVIGIGVSTHTYLDQKEEPGVISLCLPSRH